MAFPPGVPPRDNPSEHTPDFRVETVERLAGLTDFAKLLELGDWAIQWVLSLLGYVIQYLASIVGWIAVQLIKGVAKGLDAVDPAFGEIAKQGIGALFGIEVSGTAFTKLTDVGAREELKREVGKVMMRAVTGSDPDAPAKGVEPSIEPTERYLGTIANFAIEGWLMDIMVELESLGYLEHFGTLKDTVAQMFGFGRLTRRILGPIIDVGITTPARWHVNKTYRPELLSAGEVVRQISRGRWTIEQGQEELARQGWSDARIEALLNAARKFHSVSDVYRFARAGEFTAGQAVQHLRDQGYDEITATNELKLEKLRTIESFERELAALAVTAYADRRIDRAQLDDYCDGVTISTQERQQLLEIADARRTFRTKQLSPEETRSAVKDGILAVIDYRAALARDGYDETSAIVKEMQLQKELDEIVELEERRRLAEERRRQIEQERDAERQQRQADAERKAQAARRGDESELEDAAIRGVLPLDAVRSVYAARVDADVADVLMTVLEQKRSAYLEQQKQAELARQRAIATGLNIGEIEAAVLAGNLSIDEFRAHPALSRLTPADVDLLARTLEGKLRVAQQAAADRDAARERLKNRPLSLDRFELLVRRGRRTMTQYRDELRAAGFGDVAIAGMVEALELQIADDARARGARTDAERQLNQVGLSLEEFRRAVILGLKPRAAFVQFLIDQNFTADRQALLLRELDDAVSEADAARQRRAVTPSAVEARTLPLSDLAGAARLGTVTPATYQQALTAAGLSGDDVARDVDLLVTEIADVQAARGDRAAAKTPAGDKELSLAELARAVRRNLATIEDYRARAIVLGFSPGAVDTQVRVLADEVRDANVARQQRAKVVSDLETRSLSLAELEDRVRSGALSLDGYGAQLADWGLSDVDVELLSSLLEDELGAPA